VYTTVNAFADSVTGALCGSAQYDSCTGEMISANYSGCL
jgi:hypothetical protein